MSQAGIISTTAGPVSPIVPTSFVTDVNSPAVPAANVLNVLGNDTNANDDDGIRTDGSSGSNTLTVQLTNRVAGTANTSGAATSTIITFTPTVIGTYVFEFRVAVYNITSNLGAGYSIFGAIRFDGATTICDLFDEIINEEGTIVNLDIAISISGTSMIVTGTGYALQNINWSAVGLYTFAGA